MLPSFCYSKLVPLPNVRSLSYQLVFIQVHEGNTNFMRNLAWKIEGGCRDFCDDRLVVFTEVSGGVL